MNNIYTLAAIAKEKGIDNSLNENYIIKEFKETISSINVINEEVLYGDASIVPIHKVNDGYAVELESLFEVSDGYDVSLNESMDLLKKSNNLYESDNVVCVMPTNINEQLTVEEFCDLVSELNENNISVAWNSELSCDDFITEAGKLSAIKDKISDKLKNNSIETLQKNIEKCKTANEKAKEEIAKVKKMSEEDANSYVKKKAAKTIIKVPVALAASGVSGGVAGMMYTINPFLGIPAIIGSLTYSSYAGSKLGEELANTRFNKTSYIKALNDTIRLNNVTIKSCEEQIKINRSKLKNKSK